MNRPRLSSFWVYTAKGVQILLPPVKVVLELLLLVLLHGNLIRRIDLKSAIWPLDVADLAQIPFFVGHDGNGRYEFVRVFLGFARLKRQSNSNADGNGFG